MIQWTTFAPHYAYALKTGRLQHLAPQRDQVSIKLTDHGSVILDALKEKVMQPFFITRQTGSGTVLGLWLRDHTKVKGHRGTKNMKNAEGGARVFFVNLPADKTGY